jgi:hypothetical protein
MTEDNTIRAPAIWASYIINGDASGMNDVEIAACAAYLGRALPEGAAIVSCADNSHFSWNYDLYGGTAQGGDLLEYFYIVRPRRA